MKTTIVIATALFFSLTTNLNAQNKTTKNEVKTVSKEVSQDRSTNPKIQAKKDKEVVEKNITTLVEEIQKEEKNLAEIQAQKNDPANSDSKIDEAIKNSKNKINEMTEKLKKENIKLKELQKTIDSNE
ncbi:MAG: hypothetical protein P1U44_04945 [Vicingaceae bacterium]|jgi:uncharacterized protein (DUF3084 family)|nr:hypothetical protein [Flavobacteriales bacterium]MBQ21749.1 hypothetical protein [Flavobacteriales bacterium]MDF1675045.1 hypothetical protein [Vicingaceae bacterium]|tara:strand:- start:61532 stop:61915 length:384 start_codon:yes stop_codon:yes gene_type:complete